MMTRQVKVPYAVPWSHRYTGSRTLTKEVSTVSAARLSELYTDSLHREWFLRVW